MLDPKINVCVLKSVVVELEGSRRASFEAQMQIYHTRYFSGTVEGRKCDQNAQEASEIGILGAQNHLFGSRIFSKQAIHL